MREILHRVLTVGVIAAALSAPRMAIAQADTLRTPPPALPAASAGPPVLLPCNAGLELYRSQMYDLSTHAGWGMLVGGAAGFVYGFTRGGGPARGILTVWHTLVFGTAGMTVGAGVYLVRRANGRQTPARPLCVPGTSLGDPVRR